MRAFKDSEGREWIIEINVAAVKRVRDLLGEDLLQAVGGDLVERLADDPVLLCDVLYVLCKPKADERGVSDEDFGRSMVGDVIGNATTAFIEELVDFFPAPRRGLLSKAFQKLKLLEAIAIEAGEAKLDSPEFEQQMRDTISAALSGSLPGLSASTPDP